MTEEINFTVKKLKDIPPPAQDNTRDHYNDQRVPALRMEVTSKGKKSFKVYKKLNGRPIRYTIGDINDWTIENARKEAQKIVAMIANGINPNVEKQRLRQDMTFKELFDKYVQDYSSLHKKTYKEDEAALNRYAKHLYNRKVSDISREDISRLHQSIGKNNGIYAANRLLALIKSIYNKALEWGWHGDNPATRIKQFKEKSRQRFIKRAELPFFFEALNAESNKTASDYILFSLYTGARRENVLSARWNEIDWQEKQWCIPKTKNDEALTVALSDEALEVLERRRNATNSKWIFPSDVTDGHLADPKKAWRRILSSATVKIWEVYPHISPIIASIKQGADNDNNTVALVDAVRNHALENDVELPTGLLDLRIHDLRRTLGSYQAAAGANQYIIGKSLGHKSQQATAVYARLDLDPVRESVQLASSAISNAGNGGHNE